MKKFFRGKFSKISMMVVSMMTLLSVACFAVEPTTAGTIPVFDATTIMSSSFSSMTTSIFDMLKITLPYGLSIMAVSVAINFGVKFFRKLTSR